VLLPGADDTTGISRRIEGEERLRLRKLVSELSPPEGFGLIVRTAAGLDEDTAELSRDLAYLQRLWESVLEAGRHKRAPALVYREHDIVLRTIRDYFTPDIDEIHIDNEDVYLRARDFLQDVMPGKEHVLRCYRGEQPIFSAFDVEAQIDSIFKRRVPLRSGGSIVIDGTEALTAIDVNSGGSMRGANPEDTAFRTNLEAANEIARQLRLRDIGGLIVADFIDMRDGRHIQEIERTLRDALKPDKARHEVGRISRLGLLEISRQRLRPAAMATSYTTCPMCDGHGAVRTTESAALVALRKIHNRVALGDVAALHAALPGAVGLYLLNQKRDELARLEQRYESRLLIELRDSLLPHQIEMEVRTRARTERPAAVPPGGVAEVDAPAAAANGNGAATPAAAEGGGKKKRRRRGRRRGTGMRAAAAIGDALATLGGTAPPLVASESFAGASTAAQAFSDHDTHGDEMVTADAAAPLAAEPQSAPAALPRSRRGRRGGRRRRGERGAAVPMQTAAVMPAPPLRESVPDVAVVGPSDHAPSVHEATAESPPATRARRSPRPRRSRAAARPEPAGSEASGEASAHAAGVGPEAAAPAPRARRARAAGAPSSRRRKPTGAGPDGVEGAPARPSRPRRKPSK
jgi:ribonuclease E